MRLTKGTITTALIFPSIGLVGWALQLFPTLPVFIPVAAIFVGVTGSVFGSLLIIFDVKWPSIDRAAEYVPAQEAIQYIATQSGWWFTHGRARPSFVTILPAIFEFNQLALTGQLQAKARRRHTADWTEIKPEDWRVIQLDSDSILNPNSKDARSEPRILVVNPPAYDDILVSRESLRLLWPRAAWWQRIGGMIIRRYWEFQIPGVYA